MLLATMNIQYKRAKMELTKAQYEEDVAARSLEDVTSKLSDITSAAGSTTSYKSSEVYKQLVAYQSVYETRKESLDVQIEMLKEQVNSYKSALADGVEKNNNWWCLG